MDEVTFYAYTADVPVPEAVRRFVERFGVEPAALWVNDVYVFRQAQQPVTGRDLPVVVHKDVPGFAIYLEVGK